jgi:glycosyltransferase involved in cell wall biosynthesis
MFVDTASYVPIGAGPWLHVQLLRELDRTDHELYVACAPEGPGAPAPMNALVKQIPDVHVVEVDLGPDHLKDSLRGSLKEKVSVATVVVRGGWNFMRLAWFTRRRRIQVIHTDERPRDAFASVLLARISGAKCVIHMHVDYYVGMSRLVGWALKRADGIIAISDYVRGTVVDGGFDDDRTFIVRNGIDPSRWHADHDRAEARAGLGLDADAPLVLTVCRLVGGKGVDDVIRALALARREFPTARLVAVGQEQFAGYVDVLQALAADLGVGDAVTFAGWRRDVEALLSACDVFAMPSQGEPFGLAYLEAMAMERPVLAYRSGASAEVIDDKETGLLADQGDVAGLGANMIELMGRPELRRAMGEAGRSRVEAEFTLRRMAANVAAVYRRVMDR